MKDIQYPAILHWEVTPLCNHNCIHCYNYWRHDTDCLALDKTINLVDIANKIVSFKPVAVVVTGGEPFLLFEELKEPILVLRKAGIIVSINTNATLVNDEITSFLKQYNIGTLVSLPCDNAKTCDAITNVEGSHQRITQGVKTLVKGGVNVTVNMVVSQLNKHRIYNTAQFVKEELGVHSFLASRVSKPINSSDDFNKEMLSPQEVETILEELVRIKNELSLDVSTGAPIPACLITQEAVFEEFAYKKTCTAGRFSYSIDFLGNVKACVRDSTTYGNIFTESFSTIWGKMSSWRNDEFTPSECQSCSKLQVCRTGCRLEAFPLCGRLDCLDPAAQIRNIPIRFPDPTPHEIQYAIDTQFSTYGNLRLVEESFGYRANSTAKYTYLTTRFGDYLSSHKQFTVAEICSEFSVNQTVANKLINTLIEKHLIYATK